MKLKLALVGIAHFLSQGIQAQQSVEPKAQVSENTQAEIAPKNKNALPEIFEQQLRDSKENGTIIASPSHETSSGTNCHGKA